MATCLPPLCGRREARRRATPTRQVWRPSLVPSWRAPDHCPYAPGVGQNAHPPSLQAGVRPPFIALTRPSRPSPQGTSAARPSPEPARPVQVALDRAPCGCGPPRRGVLGGCEVGGGRKRLWDFLYTYLEPCSSPGAPTLALTLSHQCATVAANSSCMLIQRERSSHGAAERRGDCWHLRV